MDSVNSFKGYGKVDELDEAAFRRKLRKRAIILSVSLFLLIVLIVGIVAGTLAHKKSKNYSGDLTAAEAATVKSICSVTPYEEACFTSLESANSTDPKNIFEFSLMVVMDSLKKVADFPDDFANRTDNEREKEALKVCDVVLNDAVESLNDTISAAHGGENLASRIDDLRTWLSAAATDQEACFDALEEANATFTDEIRLLMKNSKEFASNSLAIATKIVSIIGGFKIPVHRRRLLGEFPEWVTAADRRLLQEVRPTPNCTVAADGSGDVKTVAEAVALIPAKSAERFVIYVKAGEYVEQVNMDKSHWNVMIYGDGKDATIISGSKNFVDGTPTYSTATFAIAGKGFIARDITFRNTAGAAKHQAVAFRSASDQSVYYRCSFDAFQDTLYAYSNRQFYRDCDVVGTIDFIFGNAAAVFQNCNIQPRQPLPNQFVTITAQGKTDANQNTGISIQRCTVAALDNLTAQTYLGRPWKDYSTTVVMETTIGGFLNPKGWISWVPNVDPPATIFYGEYENTGLGSGTGNRVTWAGYKPAMSMAEAARYNVESLIQGQTWLPATSVAFEST